MRYDKNLDKLACIEAPTTVGRKAVRETNVLRQHGGTIEGPLKPLEYHSSMVSKSLRGALNWVPSHQELPTLGQSMQLH